MASKIYLKEIFCSLTFLLVYEDIKPAWFSFYIYLQAADITGGVYLKAPQPLALLQYLLVSVQVPQADSATGNLHSRYMQQGTNQQKW